MQDIFRGRSAELKILDKKYRQRCFKTGDISLLKYFRWSFLAEETEAESSRRDGQCHFK